MLNDERIDEDVFQQFNHMERRENDRIAKRVYIRVCSGIYLIGLMQVWMSTKNEWCGFVRRNV